MKILPSQKNRLKIKYLIVSKSKINNNKKY